MILNFPFPPNNAMGYRGMKAVLATIFPSGHARRVGFPCTNHRPPSKHQNCQLGAGNKPDIRVAAFERGGALRREVEAEIEKAPFRSMLKTPDEGPGIQVADGGYAQLPSYESALPS